MLLCFLFDSLTLWGEGSNPSPGSGLVSSVVRTTESGVAGSNPVFINYWDNVAQNGRALDFYPGWT